MKYHLIKYNRNSFLRIGKLAIIFITILAISCKADINDIKIIKEGKTIVINGSLPRDVLKVLVQIQSSRNYEISHINQVSLRNPRYDELIKTRDSSWNIYFPVVDVSLTENMQGIATFEKSFNAEYSVNGMFHKEIYQLNSDTMIINTKKLSNWENNIYIQPAPSEMSSFYLTEKVTVIDGEINKKYDLLAEDWSGEITIINLLENEEIYKITIEAEDISTNDNSLSQYKNSGLSRERLIASLIATAKFKVRCQDKSMNNDTKGGFNLYYDLEAKTFRRPFWIWGQGPSIKVLLEAAKIPEVTQSIPADLLRNVAIEAGESTLKFQQKNPTHPAYGIIVSRWTQDEKTLHLNHGFEKFYSIADAQFLAGWGWMQLFKETGDKRYLEGVKLLTETTDKLMNEMEIIPMDYLVSKEKWKDYAMVEQGFGSEGINELFKAEPNPEYKRIGDDFMKMLIEKFDTENGLWKREYLINEKKTTPAGSRAKSKGWVAEGLLAAYELTGDKMYLDKTEKIAEHLINNQLSDGCWSFVFIEQNEMEKDEKGTSLWSYLFYRLYKYTENPKYLDVARKALTWCLDNQYDGHDPLAHGGLVGITRQSAIGYRSWYPIECLYASGFFGLAVLEELKLQQ
jgi:hypothetical protein